MLSNTNKRRHRTDSPALRVANGSSDSELRQFQHTIAKGASRIVDAVKLFAVAAALVCEVGTGNDARAEIVISNERYLPHTCVGEVFQMGEVQVRCPPRGFPLATNATIAQYRKMQTIFNAKLVAVCDSPDSDPRRPEVAALITQANRMVFRKIAETINGLSRRGSEYLRACNPLAASLTMIEEVNNLDQISVILAAERAKANNELKRKMLNSALDQLVGALADLSGGEAAVGFTAQAVNPDDYEVYLKMYPQVFQTAKTLYEKFFESTGSKK